MTRIAPLVAALCILGGPALTDRQGLTVEQRRQIAREVEGYRSHYQGNAGHYNWCRLPELWNADGTLAVGGTAAQQALYTSRDACPRRSPPKPDSGTVLDAMGIGLRGDTVVFSLVAVRKRSSFVELYYLRKSADGEFNVSEFRVVATVIED